MLIFFFILKTTIMNPLNNSLPAEKIKEILNVIYFLATLSQTLII